jgi:hypothetical protein
METMSRMYDHKGQSVCQKRQDSADGEEQRTAEGAN